MSSRNSLLFALVAAVLGMGVGFFFASVLLDSRPAEAAELRLGKPPALPAHSPSDTAQSLATPPRAQERSPAVVPAEDTAARVPEAQLARTLGAIAAPSVAAVRGAGAITGEVLDVTGAPMQDAVVVCSRMTTNQASDPADIGAGPPVDESLEEYLRKQASAWAKSRGGRLRTVTGADGQFEFTGLVETATYRLAAYLEDHVLEPEGNAYSVSPGQSVNFRAEAVHVIPVRLVHEDGRQPEAGLVGVKRGDRDTYYTWSADSPDLRVTAGRVGVRGYAGMQGSGRSRGGVDSTHGSEAISLDVGDQAGTLLELVLLARGGIRGRVIDNLGMTGGRLQVRLLPMAAGAELDENALAESDRSMYPSGDHYFFLDLAPGSYAVGLSNWNQALLAHSLVTVADGMVDVDIVVPEPDPSESLVVRAFGPSGNPLPDLKFSWMSRHGGGSSSGGIQSRRARDGAYWLNPKAEFFEAWGEETSFELTLQHSELGNRVIQLEEGQREVTVNYVEPAVVVVVVAGFAGSGYEGKLQVELTPVVAGDDDPFGGRSRGSNRGNGEGQFSPTGVARFEGLVPGPWRVSLQVKTERWQSRTVQSVEVDVLPASEKTVPMDLPALYDLVVNAPGLSKDSRLYLRPTSNGEEGHTFERSSNARIDADGRALFTSLVAGDYVLSGNGMHEQVDVTIPCGDVFVDVSEPDCLRVAIGDMEGALYKAGLRAGDLIISADGNEFESAPNAWEFLRGEGEVPVTVLRNGAHVELTVQRIPNGADWFASLGGMLTPASRP